MSIETVFIFVAYVAGTAMGLFFARDKIKKTIEETIDQLIDQGFLKAEKNANGDLDIKKWNEQ